MATIAAVILAAGSSTRMKRNKLLVDIDGVKLIRRVVDRVTSSRANPVVVVTGCDAEEVSAALAGSDVIIVKNREFRAGLSSSIRAGVTALPRAIDGFMIVLGDMPEISPALINDMIKAFENKEPPAVCVAMHNGIKGHPVLFDRHFIPDLLALTGDSGGRQLVEANKQFVFEVGAADDGPLIDIDTPEALSTYLGRPK